MYSYIDIIVMNKEILFSVEVLRVTNLLSFICCFRVIKIVFLRTLLTLAIKESIGNAKNLITAECTALTSSIC